MHEDIEIKEPNLLEFSKVIWGGWVSRIGGALSIPFTVLALYAPGDEPLIWWALAVTAILITLYKTWTQERSTSINLQRKITRLSRTTITEDMYEGVVSYHNTGFVTERTKVPFYRGVRSLDIKPIGVGSIKILVDAVSDAYADACFEQEKSVEGVQYCELHVDDQPYHEFFSANIHRVDILGDAGITDVIVKAA